MSFMITPPCTFPAGLASCGSITCAMVTLVSRTDLPFIVPSSLYATVFGALMELAVAEHLPGDGVAQGEVSSGGPEGAR